MAVPSPYCVTWGTVEGWSGEVDGLAVVFERMAGQAAMLRVKCENIQGGDGDWVPGEKAQAVRRWRKQSGWDVPKVLHSG